MRGPVTLIAVSTLCCVGLASAHASGKVDIANNGRPHPPSVRGDSVRSLDYAGVDGHENVSVTLGPTSSTFNRPLTCRSLSTKGQSAPYQAVVVKNTGAKDAVLTLRVGVAGDPQAKCGDASDTMMVVYDDFFEPASPLTNCLLVNDDAGSDGDRCSTISGLHLGPGERRVIVLTTFESFNKQAPSESAFELSFSGSLPVTLQHFTVD